MIDGTFAFVPGMGPAREKQLWRQGILRWAEFPASGTVLSPRLDDRVRVAIGEAQELLDARRFDLLAAMLPARDHWRLLAHLEPHATYVDLEAGHDERISVIGLYDAQRGPRVYVRGHNLGAFVEEPPAEAYVTFNGDAYDLPRLKRTFRHWRAPAVHVDLRTVMRQLREPGGLKEIEDRWGIGRPAHLRGVGGTEAIRLWSEFARSQSPDALRLLLEYNLHDCIQLRALAQLACAKLAGRCSATWTPRRRFVREDTLGAVDGAIEKVVAHARTIVADAIDDEERVALRVG